MLRFWDSMQYFVDVLQKVLEVLVWNSVEFSDFHRACLRGMAQIYNP